NAFGGAATCDIFTVTSGGPPTISSFSPPSAGTGTPSQAGGLITVNGTNFVNVTEVLLNGVPQGFFVSNATSLIFFPTFSGTSGLTPAKQHAGTAVSDAPLTITPMTYCEGTPPAISGINASAFDPGSFGILTGFNFTPIAATYFPNDPAAAFLLGTNGGGTSAGVSVNAGAASGPPYVVTDSRTATA